ncbi:MAG: hypothetical protein O7F08_10015 [Deltaproteobacteria bacterium]|nr:hypothetical protein [Deltaproteobacteria bacterium]
MHNNTFSFFVLACTGLLVLGCGDDGGGGSHCPTGEVECDGVCIPEIETTLEGAQGIQAAVFDISCTLSACHDSQAPQEMLSLISVEVSRANLIDVEAVQVSKPRVDPGNVENSYIINKVLGEGIAPTTLQMPFGIIPLCDAKIEALVEWVALGAP